MNRITDTTKLVQRAFRFTPMRTPEEKKFRQYVKSKKSGSKIRGIEYNLTNEELQQLLDEAGITIWDVGPYSGMFCLGRYGDTGPYEVGNCRFITVEENTQEWWDRKTPEEQEEHRDRGRKNATNAKWKRKMNSN
jgi:hypothetical protein